MPTYVTEAQVRAKIAGVDQQAARVFLAFHNALAAFRDEFDIFLSHSIKDASLILGIKRLLEEAGKSVYIDWIGHALHPRERAPPALHLLILDLCFMSGI
ncbi:hypothetical protein CES85_2262 [Ochrobactrum quorumnocens]|uniref:TIR domain-containing protein n=1 Tax=Ochrobactrum quorumnocens TaxID=271865 RepID=A0A248UH43_9HYPH|nr:hypothetical protein [[Ochrobactrum] quorumnocens]ASV85984.1 hypothetical protein CES85_2262 [[Ochrobactrum] quorumnocens]